MKKQFSQTQAKLFNSVSRVMQYKKLTSATSAANTTCVKSQMFKISCNIVKWPLWLLQHKQLLQNLKC